MRKVFVFIAIIGMAAMINSCGTAGKISNDPYRGEGHGFSAVSNGKDIAREKAFIEACAEITRKSGVEISEDAKRLYNSNESAKGKAKELLSYGSTVNSKANAVISDIVVVKEKVYRKNGGWNCDVVLKVDDTNVE